MREKVTLGSLCKSSKGQISLEKDELIDYFDISSVDNESKQIIGHETYIFSEAPSRARKSVQKGNVIVSTVRPNLNAVALFNEDTDNVPVVSTGFCVLDCKENVDINFVFQFCKSKTFIEDMVSKATGASYPAVSDKIIRETLVPLYTYEEQQDIANKLTKVTDIISMRRKELLILDNLIKSRFVEMFGNPMTNSKGYELKSYGELFELNAGGTPSKQKPEYWDNGSISWIGSNMCQNAIIYENDGNYITEEGFNHSSARMFPVDTVLIALVGATIGKTALLKFETTTNQNVLGVRKIRESGYTPEFIFYYTQGLYQKFLNIGDGGFAMASKGFISELPVPVIGLDLQEQFTTFANQVDKLKSEVQKSLDAAQLLMDSLMQQYFG